jgi:hypothetical protein
MYFDGRAFKDGFDYKMPIHNSLLHFLTFNLHARSGYCAGAGEKTLHIVASLMENKRAIGYYGFVPKVKLKLKSLA